MPFEVFLSLHLPRSHDREMRKMEKGTADLRRRRSKRSKKGDVLRRSTSPTHTHRRKQKSVDKQTPKTISEEEREAGLSEGGGGRTARSSGSTAGCKAALHVTSPSSCAATRRSNKAWWRLKRIGAWKTKVTCTGASKMHKKHGDCSHQAEKKGTHIHTDTQTQTQTQADKKKDAPVKAEAVALAPSASR